MYLNSSYLYGLLFLFFSVLAYTVHLRDVNIRILSETSLYLILAVAFLYIGQEIERIKKGLSGETPAQGSRENFIRNLILILVGLALLAAVGVFAATWLFDVRVK